MMSVLFNHYGYIVTFLGSDNSEVDMKILDIIEYNDEEFLITLPIDSENEILIFQKISKIENDIENEYYIIVEDELLSERVFSVFQELNNDLYDFDH